VSLPSPLDVALLALVVWLIFEIEKRM